jgi:phosphoserine phosphatase
MDGVLAKCSSSWVQVHDHFGVNNKVSLDLFLEHKIDDMEFMRRDIALWRSKDPRLTISKIKKILGDVELNDNVQGLFRALKDKGLKTAIVSGGIDILADKIKGMIDCDYVLANGLETDHRGRLTGEGILRVPVLSKDLVVKKFQSHFSIPKRETVSVGNSMVDVAMFRESDLGIAFNPEDELTKEACDVEINGTDLMKILEFI